MLGLYYPNSHMWGVLFLHFFRQLNIPIYLLDWSNLGQLHNIKVLIVPGGFASEKAKGLGKKGLYTIREYVKQGGVYVGFCGGAGLGLSQGENSIGICDVKRKPISQRIPNFSGHIKVDLKNLDEFGIVLHKKNICLPVWWPSQFNIEPQQGINIISTYNSPSSDLWIADMPFSVLNQMDVKEIEQLYGINLDFSLLKGEPCIISGSYGKGKYILSYAHLETPSSLDANNLLVLLLERLMQVSYFFKKVEDIDLKSPIILWEDKSLLFAWKNLLRLIYIGEENFLFCWRKKWLLGWRRGVIGLCLNSLLCMIWFLLLQNPNIKVVEEWKKQQGIFIDIFKEFCNKFENYIILQRYFYLTNTHRPPDKLENLPIHKLILELTGPFPGDGGLFKKLVDILEYIVICIYKYNKK